MFSSEPLRRREGGESKCLRRSFSIRLTLRQYVLLQRASSADCRTFQELVTGQLQPFFADLEQRFPDHASG